MTEIEKTQGLLSADFQEAILHLKDRVSDLEGRLSLVEDAIRKPPPRQRVARNYEDYMKVQEILKRGVSINRAAKILLIPYTTVHYYATANQEAVEKLKGAPRLQDGSAGGGGGGEGGDG